MNFQNSNTSSVECSSENCGEERELQRYHETIEKMYECMMWEKKNDDVKWQSSAWNEHTTLYKLYTTL